MSPAIRDPIGQTDRDKYPTFVIKEYQIQIIQMFTLCGRTERAAMLTRMGSNILSGAACKAI